MAFYDIQDFKTVRIQVAKSIKLAKSQKERKKKKMVPEGLEHSNDIQCMCQNMKGKYL